MLPGAVTPVSLENNQSGADDRAYLVGVLIRIAGPVLEALSQHQLKDKFPVHDWDKNHEDTTRTEAFARTLAGISPWIELGYDETEEGRLREKFGCLARTALVNATDPESPDYMCFSRCATGNGQPLVEAAQISQALLRSPNVLWEPLTEAQKKNVIASLKASREIQPWQNNWVLFGSVVEACLWNLTGEARLDRLKYGLDKFKEWYRGDGIYSDGPEFHWDYYNSYVIHPTLLDVLKICRQKGYRPIAEYDEEVWRAQRHAVILERMISPEATFPVVGRSSAYRFAAFQTLSQIILWKKLPEEVGPGAARAGITAVVRRMTEAPGTFDKEGWLQIGVVGHQPSIRDPYTATGSLYICLSGLIHLGLPAGDPFWQACAADWTQRKIWSGQDIPGDHALSAPYKSSHPRLDWLRRQASPLKRIYRYLAANRVGTGPRKAE